MKFKTFIQKTYLSSCEDKIYRELQLLYDIENSILMNATKPPDGLMGLICLNPEVVSDIMDQGTVSNDKLKLAIHYREKSLIMDWVTCLGENIREYFFYATDEEVREKNNPKLVMGINTVITSDDLEKAFPNVSKEDIERFCRSISKPEEPFYKEVDELPKGVAEPEFEEDSKEDDIRWSETLDERMKELRLWNEVLSIQKQVLGVERYNEPIPDWEVRALVYKGEDPMIKLQNGHFDVKIFEGEVFYILHGAVAEKMTMEEVDYSYCIEPGAFYFESNKRIFYFRNNGEYPKPFKNFEYQTQETVINNIMNPPIVEKQREAKQEQLLNKITEQYKELEKIIKDDFSEEDLKSETIAKLRKQVKTYKDRLDWLRKKMIDDYKPKKRPVYQHIVPDGKTDFARKDSDDENTISSSGTYRFPPTWESEKLPIPQSIKDECNDYYLVKLDNLSSTAIMAMYMEDEEGNAGWYTNYVSKIVKRVVSWMYIGQTIYSK